MRLIAGKGTVQTYIAYVDDAEYAQQLLRSKLGFNGVAMTDDLAMDAVSAYAKEGNVAVLALQAGNDLLVTSDYRTQFSQVLQALKNGTLNEETVDAACARVLIWKMALGLL